MPLPDHLEEPYFALPSEARDIIDKYAARSITFLAAKVDVISLPSFENGMGITQSERNMALEILIQLSRQKINTLEPNTKLSRPKKNYRVHYEGDLCKFTIFDAKDNFLEDNAEGNRMSLLAEKIEKFLNKE